MPAYSLAEVRESTYKKRDAWFTVLMVDPLASRLVRITANHTRITANQLTAGSVLLGAAAAGSFLVGTRAALVLGGLLYLNSFLLDCMDGKMARLTGTGTAFGGWLDFMLDRVVMTACTVTLMTGQYLRTGEVGYLFLATAVVFLISMRYLNALQVGLIRRRMTARLRAEQTELEPDADLHDVVRRRFPSYLAARRWLARHRIRTHLFSGIEFQMAVLVVGPVLGVVGPATVTASALLITFEAAVCYKFRLLTKEYGRELQRRRAAAPTASLTPDDGSAHAARELVAVGLDRVG